MLCDQPAHSALRNRGGGGGGAVQARSARAGCSTVLLSSAGTRLLDRAGERACQAPASARASCYAHLAEGRRSAVSTVRARRRCARWPVRRQGGERAPADQGRSYRRLLRRSGKIAKPLDRLVYDGRQVVELRAARLPAAARWSRMRAVGGDRRLSRPGMDLLAAVRQAKRYVTAALRASFRLGAGRAVLDHFASGGRQLR